MKMDLLMIEMLSSPYNPAVLREGTAPQRVRGGSPDTCPANGGRESEGIEGRVKMKEVKRTKYEEAISHRIH